MRAETVRNIETRPRRTSSLILLGCALALCSGCQESPTPVTSAAPAPQLAEAVLAPFVLNTYVYKTVGEVELKADVYRSDDDVTRPVLVWFHGGALIFGHRREVPKRFRTLSREEGFILVSLDYRLSPEVKLPGIIEDVRDGLNWVRREGPEKFHADPEKIVVGGGSAGGYLTLMAGICVSPPPKALVSYFGYGDVDGDWYSIPSEHHRTAFPLVSEEEARGGVGGKVLTGERWGTPVSDARRRYYHYLRQNGLWTREITGFDPKSEREKLDPYCPVRNVSNRYPPTLMIHGTEDGDVPYEKSEAMLRELKRHNVPCELIGVKGAGHGLRGGGDEAEIAAAHARVLEFVKEHLK